MKPIDRLSSADSMITLLGRLNVEPFPPEERMAVARLQVEAIEDWLAAYLDGGAAHGPNAVAAVPWNNGQ
jgi:hypothetical protein